MVAMTIAQPALPVAITSPWIQGKEDAISMLVATGRRLSEGALFSDDEDVRHATFKRACELNAEIAGMREHVAHERWRLSLEMGDPLLTERALYAWKNAQADTKRFQ